MAVVADGGSIIEVAQRFSVSVDAIYDWKRRLRETASVAPRAGHGGRPRRLTPEQDRRLRDRIDAVPDATIGELQAWLAADQQIVVGWTTVWRAVARLDRTRKKRV
jgi:transposase